MNKITKALIESKSILMTTHINPDADGVGCLIALYEILLLLNKDSEKIYIRLADPISATLKLLDVRGVVQQYHPDEPLNVETIVIVDVSDLNRIGRVKECIKEDKTIIHIDHHIAYEKISSLSLHDPQAASTSEVLYPWLLHENIPLNEIAAKALYASLIHDTGEFLYNNVSKTTFEFAAYLKNHIKDHETLVRSMFHQNSLKQLKLYAKALERLELDESSRVAFTVLYESDFKELALEYEASEGVVELLNTLQEADIILLLKELKTGAFKGSLRSQFKNVETIARFFNGGGHRAASGFSSLLTASEIVSKVKEITKNLNMEESCIK